MTLSIINYLLICLSADGSVAGKKRANGFGMPVEINKAKYGKLLV